MAEKINIIYKVEHYYDEIRLFGKKFIDNNKNNCKIIIDSIEKDLTGCLYDIKKYKKKEKLEIQLIGIDKITDMSNMFSGCKSLVSLPNISKWDISKVTSLKEIFSGCESISLLDNISKWNTSNVTDMSALFWNCLSLKSLPNISLWDTSKVINMSYIFSGCKSLSSLPNIS